LQKSQILKGTIYLDLDLDLALFILAIPIGKIILLP